METGFRMSCNSPAQAAGRRNHEGADLVCSSQIHLDAAEEGRNVCVQQTKGELLSALLQCFQLVVPALAMMVRPGPNCRRYRDVRTDRGMPRVFCGYFGGDFLTQSLGCSVGTELGACSWTD